MFVDFLYGLRRQGVPVGAQEWLAFHEALGRGLIEDIDTLYAVGRALLVHTESLWDAFDLAFAEHFEGIEAPALREALLRWLSNPLPPKQMTEEEFQRLTGLSLDELRQKFEAMLREQQERHDGGSRYIGTGGSSPFGSQGKHPSGLRLGKGGGRSAIQVAGARRYRNYRTDAVIDVRQFKVALRALRNLTREGREVLDLDETIDETSRQGGEIELVFRPDRKNSVRLLLLMDAGGSMDPYARLVDQLFTAAHESQHWKSFDHFFFHNIMYSRLYSNFERFESTLTEELIRKYPPTTKVVYVGDACMSPWELSAAGGALSWDERNPVSGMGWLRKLRKAFKSSVWLNPEQERYWNHPTIRSIGEEVPMFPLTVEGLTRAVKELKAGQGARG